MEFIVRRRATNGRREPLGEIARALSQCTGGLGLQTRERHGLARRALNCCEERSRRHRLASGNVAEDRLSDEQACEIYRARWQVELYFKRLKSLGDLDMQPSRDGPTARAGLLAKMILLVLTSLLQDQEQAFSPYGYPVRQARTEPLEGICLRPKTNRRRPAAQKTKAQAINDQRALIET